jgi:hypothetical protein
MVAVTRETTGLFKPFKDGLNIVPITTMSASVERLFSSSNFAVCDRWNGLNTIEIIDGRKSWQRLSA